MSEKSRNALTNWIVIAVVAIIILLYAGLLPLPGQKDKVTPHTEPSGTSPQVQAPKGPPSNPSSVPGAGTQPPPGGTPSATPGSTGNATSSQTTTGAGPSRDPK